MNPFFWSFSLPVIIGSVVILGIVFYISRKKTQKRQSLQELARGVDGTVFRKSLMGGDFLQGEHRGIAFSCRFSPGSKNTPPSMTIKTGIACPAGLTIRREAWYDRFARRIGLVTELQTGDPAFDQAYYLDTDEGNIILPYFAQDTKRRAVDALFGLGYPVRKIVFGKTDLQLVLSPFPQDAIATLPLAQYLEEIQKLSSEQSSAGYAASFNPQLFPGGNRGPLSRGGLKFLLTFNGLLITAGVFALAYGMSEYEPLGQGLIVDTLFLSVPAAFFYLFFVFRWIRGRSSSHRYFLTILILSLIGFPLFLVGGALTTNGVFDQGEETSHRVQVSKLYYRQNKNSRTYHVAFPSWLKPGETEDISIPSNLYRVLHPASEIIVRTKPGYWQEEWIAGIEPSAEAGIKPDPSGAYPIRLTSVRFYESGATRVTEQDKRFAAQFARGTSRYINCQVNMENDYWNIRDQSYNFVWHYINPDGSIRGKVSYPFTVRSAWHRAWVVSSWGWENPGNWPAGKYTVAVYVNGRLFGKGYFVIR